MSVVHYSSCPEGADALMLANIAKDAKNNIIYVARDDNKLDKISAQVRFFAPNLKVITLPSWDCLPYDRVSPSISIISKRIASLCKIIDNKEPCIIITSVNSFLQKLPPQNELKNATLKLSLKDKLNRDDLINYLLKYGYNRVSTANESGEFAVRGSIVDVCAPAVGNQSYRLDFFGDSLEYIKIFDPATQISESSVTKVTLYPASEIIFTDENIELFADNYLQNFGVNSINDSIYLSINEHRKYPAMEQYLPLFYNNMENIFSYSQANIIAYDHLVEQAISERLEVIKDYYQARIENLQKKLDNYNPIKPEFLWLDQAILDDYLARGELIKFDPFTNDLGQNLDYKKISNLSILSASSGQTALTLLKEFIAKGRINSKGLQYKPKTMIACYSAGSLNRMQNLLDGYEIHHMVIEDWQQYHKLSGKSVGLLISPFDSGFESNEFNLFSEQDIIGERIGRTKKSRKKLENYLSEAASLSEGELVVHKEHGIGRFYSLETLYVGGIAHDCLRIDYAGGDKLYLPVENIELITRYGSVEGGELDRLGGASWQSRKARLKKRIKAAAEELLKIAAERAAKQASILQPAKGLYEEFCARFPYAETDDQLSSIAEIEEDLISGKPMDRLICGDVGFGKTEIALRAAFIAIKSEGEKKQVAVVVPTTLLARQHYKTFIERFKDFGVNIRQLSRLVTAKDSSLTKQQLKSGEVDIVIGTHAVLAKSIEFHNLALLIIDEEQHFGVLQKERLKQLKSNIHVLTLSATPIPRTLQMSLAGIKELSLIATPPVDRLAVRTAVMPYDAVTVREAILREHYRGGRCFYVCPRISDMAEVEIKIKTLVPEIKIITAHGQMPSTKLDDIMNDFYDGKYDLLLSTTIVESGLDIPAANTIFIHRADILGLAQLYQLRGRVGRGKIRAYAYLLTNPNKMLTKDATKRLTVMQTLDSLGAGFSLASHDMDIRGFGNLVGDEQSGHIREVGIELYQDMLKEAIENLKCNTQEDASDNHDFVPQINCGLSVLIPENYVSDLPLRLGLYKRISNLKDDLEINNFNIELVDRFGALPVEVKHLMDIVSLKLLCIKLNLNKIDAGPKAVVLGFHNNKFFKADAIVHYALTNPHKMKIRPDHKLVLYIECEEPEKRLKLTREALVIISNL